MAKTINPLKTIKGLETEYRLKPGALRFIFLEIGDGSVGHRELAQRLAKRFKLPSSEAHRLTNYLAFGKFVVLDEEKSDLKEGVRRAMEAVDAHGRGKALLDRPDTTIYKLGYKTREYCKLKRVAKPSGEKTYMVAQEFHLSFLVKTLNKTQAKKIEDAIADKMFEMMTEIATSAGGIDSLEGSRSVVLEHKGKWWRGHDDMEVIKHRLAVERYRLRGT